MLRFIRNERLIRFVVASTPREQALIVAASAILLPFYYLSLEFPKLIVNSALSIVPPHFPHVIRLLDWEIATVGQLTLLLLYCLGLLGVQLAHGLVKLFINVYKAVAGERVLLRMRRALIISLVSSDRRPDPDDARGGRIISIVTAELEPLSGFVADAIATPVFEAGLLVTAYVFIFQQNLLVGAVLLVLYPVQLLVVPRLQERQTRLEATRVDHVRALGDLVPVLMRGSENLDRGALSRFEQLTDDIYDTRRAFYRIKFFINFLLNVFGQIIVFGIYLYGGHLVVRGELSVGSLVAIAAAHKDLLAPWKELLDFWQQYRSSETKLNQILTGIGQDGRMLDSLALLTDHRQSRRDATRGVFTRPRSGL